MVSVERTHKHKRTNQERTYATEDQRSRSQRQVKCPFKLSGAGNSHETGTLRPCPPMAVQIRLCNNQPPTAHQPVRPPQTPSDPFLRPPQTPSTRRHLTTTNKHHKPLFYIIAAILILYITGPPLLSLTSPMWSFIHLRGLLFIWPLNKASLKRVTVVPHYTLVPPCTPRCRGSGLDTDMKPLLSPY
eukprot:246281-Pyramimonas_sp.AAC.1